MIELYLGDSPEIAGHSANTLKETAWSLLLHIMVLKYMSLYTT